MSKKKDFGQRLESFFAGKGFYIVLFLCVTVIGVSAWVMFSGMETDVEPALRNDTAEDPAPGNMAVPSETGPAVTKEPVQEGNGAENAAETMVEPEAPEVEAGLTEPSTEAESVMSEAEAEAAAVWAEAADYFIWPCNGPVEVPHTVTTLRYDRTMADWRTHDGVDIAVDLGEQVMAAASGRVSAVYTDNMYGVTVEIDHGGGLTSLYSNLTELPTVTVGDGVMVGEVIGCVGNTALCETAEVYHLHFAMRQDGQSVDPADYMPPR
ncbi:MAG: M23 family metallopeptidase [Eubacteriales bacterium]|nr:M23 family metallopeptidase [Eubacteriales bacterium]